MTDKEKIKQEIERLYNLYELAKDYQRMGACSTILDFINSLPEEPFDYTNANIIPKDFGELPQTIEQAAVQAHIELEERNGLSFVNIFSKGAEWQKQQMMKGAVEIPKQCYDNHTQSISCCLPIGFVKDKSRLKIIIVKED